MRDLIGRQAAIDAMKEWMDDAAYLHDVVECLRGLPSAQPERQTGKWIPQDMNKKTGTISTALYYYPKCSECGCSGENSMNYCPNCGAKMED